MASSHDIWHFRSTLNGYS